MVRTPTYYGTSCWVSLELWNKMSSDLVYIWQRTIHSLWFLGLKADIFTWKFRLWDFLWHHLPSLCRFLPYVGWLTIIMTEKPIIKVSFHKKLEKIHNFIELIVFFYLFSLGFLGVILFWLFLFFNLIAVYSYRSIGIAGYHLKGLEIQLFKFTEKWFQVPTKKTFLFCWKHERWFWSRIKYTEH